MPHPDFLDDEPDDTGAPLPIVRDPRKPMGPALQKKIIKAIRRSVRQHGSFEVACEQEGLPRDLLEKWIADDEHLAVTLVKDRADFKAELAMEARDKNCTPNQRKMSLEQLGRVDKEWAPRSRTTLGTQLQDFLDESKRVEPPEIYARWLTRLGKYL
jgi:hypothetical protein